VLDVSPGGLYVQTSAKVEPGDRLDLELSLPGVARQLELQVEVMRKVVVPARLRALAHGGIGVRILNAPEAYYKFMETLGSGADSGGFKGKGGKHKKTSSGKASPLGSAQRTVDAKPAPPPEPEPKPEPEPRYKFRIHIKQIRGSRSRNVKLSADSEQEARRLALEEVGEGWEVLRVEYL